MMCTQNNSTAIVCSAMRRFRRIAAVGFLSAVVGVAGVAHAGPPGPDGPPPMVAVVPVTVEDINPPDEYVGHVEAVQSVDLRARVQGVLEQVRFAEGGYIQSGDLLFEIEQAPYRAAVNAARAALAQAEAAVFKANQYMKRIRDVRSGGVSGTDIDNAKAEVLRAEAQLQGARADLERAELDLGYTQIAAPISGRIGATHYTHGNLVGPDSGSLARIVQIDPVRVVYSIGENDLAAVRAALGDASRSKGERLLAPKIRLGDGQQTEIAGQIDFVDNMVDPDTGTVKVRALFDNGGGKLLPGQYVTVLISRRAPAPMPVVPQAAVLEDQEGRYVLLVVDGDKVTQRRITTGAMVDGNWSVTEGLTAGDKVIVQGLQKVRPGMTVRVTPENGR